MNAGKLYVLNPHLRVAQYAGRHYAYDARLTAHPLVEIPTRSISRGEHDVLHRMKSSGFFLEPKSESEIESYLVHEGFPLDLTGRMVQQNYFKLHRGPGEILEKKVLDYFDARYDARRRRYPFAPPFDDENGNLRVFSPKTFFNLPLEVAAAERHVGLLGFPHASLEISLGTEQAPALFRLHSRSSCWFDICKQGVYSEIAVEGDRPDVLCKNVVLRDAGDLDFQNAGLTEMTDQVQQVLRSQFLDQQAIPLIIGGDHAVTYPAVLAYLQAMPRLGLIHLDAHNDLFYTDKVVYSHAALISNLIRRTSIERIASFGLRTFTDKRMSAIGSVYDMPDSAGRIRLYPITSLKQLIMDPNRLDRELCSLAGRPYYLTLDLDVLSDAAIGRQVSTPFGSGLEWHELLYFLNAAFRRLSIVAGDIVEYNIAHGESRGEHRFLLNSLLLLLIDRLAEGSPKFREHESAAAVHA